MQRNYQVRVPAFRSGDESVNFNLSGHASLWSESSIFRDNLRQPDDLQAVRQTVRIVSMDHPQGVLRTGDRATVQFEFISHPEFIKVGMKLLFREGKTKVSNERETSASPLIGSDRASESLLDYCDVLFTTFLPGDNTPRWTLETYCTCVVVIL